MVHHSRDTGRTHHHTVQFYGEQAELLDTICTFLGEGLVAGEPAIVIATPAHSAAIAGALGSHRIDVPRARHLGDLVVLDAEDTLGTLLNDGMPDAFLFQRNIGALVEQTLRGRAHTPIRVYGEMVDVLWRRGQADAAIRLEVLWNELAATCAISLLCGYAIANFDSESSRIEEICRQHTHVIGTDIFPPEPAPQARA